MVAVRPDSHRLGIAAAWIGGLIITGKADIRYQITRVTALAVLPVQAMVLAVCHGWLWLWRFCSDHGSGDSDPMDLTTVVHCA